MRGNARKERTPRMDDDLAFMFAYHEYRRRYPQSTWPEWFRRCVVEGYSTDANRNVVVTLTVTPLATLQGEAFFRVLIHPVTAETTVLLDRNLIEFHGPLLAGFVPIDRIAYLTGKLSARAGGCEVDAGDADDEQGSGDRDCPAIS